MAGFNNLTYKSPPINLRRQIGILSLANQNLAKGLPISVVQVFLNLYFSVPVWALLFVPARLLKLKISTGERPFIDIFQDRRYWVIHLITIPSLFLAGIFQGN